MSELTRPMRDFLAAPHFAVAATLQPDGLPHQTVMWYLLEEDGTLLLNTPAGSRKHRHLKRDPRISVCIEDGYRYLTMQGIVEINEDPDGAGQDYARLGERYRGTFSSRLPRAGRERLSILNRGRVTLRLTVERVLSVGF